MTSRRPLEILGIDEFEEQVWRALLATGWATIQELAREVSLPAQEVRRLLDRIEAKGLATHASDRQRRYTAVSPDVAIEALVSQRRADLERARSSMHELVEQVSSNRSKAGEQLVEIVPRSVIGALFSQLLQASQEEIVSFQRAPILSASIGPHPDQASIHARGVRIRCIADTEYLAMAGVMKMVHGDINAGEEFRVLPRLPAKMVISDRRIGLIPLSLVNPTGPSLLIRQSALLDVLYAHFETLWERATPLAFTASGEVVRCNKSANDLLEDSHDLVALLVAGLPDKSIAHELGISPATLSRRLAELMKTMSARTRFQAGWIAARAKASRSS